MALKKKTGINLEFQGIHEIKYQNREEKWNGNNFGIDPTLIKEEEFKQQGELRAIWKLPYKVEIEPIIITDIRIAKRCKHMSVL
jgi:hypothetical protein